MNHFGNSPVVINFRLASGDMRLLFFTKSLHIGEKLSTTTTTTTTTAED